MNRLKAQGAGRKVEDFRQIVKDGGQVKLKIGARLKADEISSFFDPVPCAVSLMPINS